MVVVMFTSKCNYLSIIWILPIVINEYNLYGNAAKAVTDDTSTSSETPETPAPNTVTTPVTTPETTPVTTAALMPVTTAATTPVTTAATTPVTTAATTPVTTAATTEVRKNFPARDGQFPFICRLYLKGFGSHVTCTGTIIEEGLIITAGKCCRWRVPSAEIVLGRVNHEPYVQRFARDGYSFYKVTNRFLGGSTTSSEFTGSEICAVTVADWSNTDGHGILRWRDSPIRRVESCVVVGWGRPGADFTSDMLSYSYVDTYVCGDYFCVNKTDKENWDAGSPLICDGNLVGLGTSSLGEIDMKSDDGYPKEYYFRMSKSDGFLKRAEVRPKRMLTGSDAVDGQFPFICRLYITTEDDKQGSCTGVILKDDLIVTSGECCTQASSGFAVTGSVNMTNVNLQKPNEPYYVYRVRKFVVHPLLYIGMMRQEHALCMVFLEAKMKREDGHKTAILADSPFVDGTVCTVASYGKGADGVIMNRLIYDNASFSTCYTAYLCSDKHIACAGDGGAPVMCGGITHAIYTFYTREKSSNYYCEEGGIDFFTLLSSEKSFIQDAMNGILSDGANGCPVSVPGESLFYTSVYLISVNVYVSFLRLCR
ncbi:UNVERIFIED_CONTAM: hypothetical protein PYX00_002655 [Menopon gallinae]|uniref:Peptidase S1 domain-containing protein n=1 Tax=Menopon gallinae TaxID=328185 RepID=A0AAW2HYX7_9NEOP